MLLDATARSVSREHAEQVLAVWDCHRQRGVTTAFTFHSSNARAERFQQATESVLAALEVLVAGNNALTALPSSIGKLRTLKKLPQFEGWESQTVGGRGVLSFLGRILGRTLGRALGRAPSRSAAS